MFLSSCVIAKFDQEKQELSRISRNVLTGIFWTIANISLFYIATQLGVGLSFIPFLSCASLYLLWAGFYY